MLSQKRVGLLLLATLILLILHVINTKGQETTAKKKTRLKDVHIVPVNTPDDCQVKAEKGDTIVVDYTGRLEDGKVFDSSQGEGREPIAFKLGTRKVIPGWEKGVMGMCIGEERKLIIPPHLAYGDEGVPPHIPGKATLEFDVKAVDVQKPSALKSVISFAKFAALPVAVGVVVYMAYQKYMSKKGEEALSKKKQKEERKQKKRK